MRAARRAEAAGRPALVRHRISSFRAEAVLVSARRQRDVRIYDRVECTRLPGGRNRHAWRAWRRQESLWTAPVSSIPGLFATMSLRGLHLNTGIGAAFLDRPHTAYLDAPPSRGMTAEVS